MSTGVAEIDDANAATAARTVVEERRIVSEDGSEEDCHGKETAGFYVLNIGI